MKRSGLSLKKVLGLAAAFDADSDEITDAQMQALHRQVDLVEKLGIEWENFAPKQSLFRPFRFA